MLPDVLEDNLCGTDHSGAGGASSSLVARLLKTKRKNNVVEIYKNKRRCPFFPGKIFVDILLDAIEECQV